MNLYRKFFKRAIDIAASGGVLAVLSVPLAAITLWLHFANKGAGAFFMQERPGKDGKIFKVIKFKTMTDERDADGNLLPDSRRLTRVGRFVRSTSIDELPQLINVLKGDMSLIGPRPLLVRYLPLYTPEQARRHEGAPASPDGRSATAATRSPGPVNSNSMSGMSTISRSPQTAASCGPHFSRRSAATEYPPRERPRPRLSTGTTDTHTNQ